MMTITRSTPELVLYPPLPPLPGHTYAGEHYWTSQEAKVVSTRASGGTVVVEKVRRDGAPWSVTYSVESGPGRGTTGAARTTAELVAALERHLHGALSTGQRQVLTRWVELPEGGHA